MAVQLRLLSESDAAAYWHLRLEAFTMVPEAFGTAASEHAATRVADAAERIRSSAPGSFILGAFDSQQQPPQLVGVARIERQTGVKERHKAGLCGVYVTASHRRRGVGRALVTAALERAAADPTLEAVLVSAAAGQRDAQRLYESLGFTVFGIEPRSIKLGDEEYVDELLMVNRVR